MIKIVKADITGMNTDAIVNAANPFLIKGGGVSGAIFKAAGKELSRHCRKLGILSPGEAVITPGFKLKAKYVVHTVVPIFGDTGGKARKVLEACYRNSLNLAEEHGLESVAFPCIGTGFYSFPFEEACRIALGAAKESNKMIYMVCYTKKDYDIYIDICGGMNK